MNLKPLVNEYALYQSFLEYVNKRLEGVHRGLETANDPKDFYRLQGQADLLKKLLLLREEVNGR